MGLSVTFPVPTSQGDIKKVLLCSPACPPSLQRSAAIRSFLPKYPLAAPWSFWDPRLHSFWDVLFRCLQFFAFSSVFQPCDYCCLREQDVFEGEEAKPDLWGSSSHWDKLMFPGQKHAQVREMWLQVPQGALCQEPSHVPGNLPTTITGRGDSWEWSLNTRKTYHLPGRGLSLNAGFPSSDVQ